MSFSRVSYPEDKAERYEVLLAQAVALLDDTLNPIANLANIAALLYDALGTINWCGFYLMDDGALTLAPFCGLPACTRIPIGRGICGTAAPDGHDSACRRCTRLPRSHCLRQCIAKRGLLCRFIRMGMSSGVLDIDSPALSRFDETDELYLVQLVRHIQNACRFDQTAYRI